MAGFLFIALTPFGYDRFLAGALLVVFAYNFITTALAGAGLAIAAKYRVSSKYVGLSTLAGYLVGALTALIGGWAAVHIPYRTFLLTMALCCPVLVIYGFFRPRSITLPKQTPQGTPIREKRDFRVDAKRLLTSRGFLPVFIVSVIWGFSPFGTTYLFLLQDRLHGNMQDVGTYNAIGSVGGWCGTLAYVVLVRRFRAKSILAVGTTICIGQFAPLYFAHTLGVAYVASAGMSLVGSLVGVSLFDLQVQACPEGLEGVALALIGLCAGLMTTASNIWGSALYEHQGVLAPILLNGVVTALALPVIFRIPRGDFPQGATIEDFAPGMELAVANA
jgi:hypothetical protein